MPRVYGLYIQKEVKIMNKYESIIIIGQNVEEDGIKALISRFTDLINTEGKVSN